MAIAIAIAIYEYHVYAELFVPLRNLKWVKGVSANLAPGLHRTYGANDISKRSYDLVFFFFGNFTGNFATNIRGKWSLTKGSYLRCLASCLPCSRYCAGIVFCIRVCSCLSTEPTKHFTIRANKNDSRL